MLNFLQIFKRKDCNYSEKLCFLIDQTYKHFCKQHKIRIGKKLDFHYTHYAKQSTLDAMFPVIQESRIDQCFSNCVNQLKREGKLLELQNYGIL